MQLVAGSPAVLVNLDWVAVLLEVLKFCVHLDPVPLGVLFCENLDGRTVCACL